MCFFQSKVPVIRALRGGRSAAVPNFAAVHNHTAAAVGTLGGDDVFALDHIGQFIISIRFQFDGLSDGAVVGQTNRFFPVRGSNGGGNLDLLVGDVPEFQPLSEIAIFDQVFSELTAQSITAKMKQIIS